MPKIMNDIRNMVQDAERKGLLMERARRDAVDKYGEQTNWKETPFPPDPDWCFQEEMKEKQRIEYIKKRVRELEKREE